MFRVRALLKIILCLFVFTNVKAQLGKEAWHWQFGNNCALDFSSGSPVVGTSAINTIEGSASVSDPITGQLLFYTDGVSVWNRSNIQMPNGYGLLGHYSSAQSALIVPWPGNNGFYYIISSDQAGYYGPNKGVHYSVVNMNLNGGFGDITTKNILLTPPPATENAIAVKHCNNTDYWIITHTDSSNAFNVYLLNSSGINPIPIVSKIGLIQKMDVSTYIKTSPNGNKLATGLWGSGTIELFDFNRMTGKLSNPILILSSNGDNGLYAVSFSPDNLKLYATFPNVYKVYQFDLSNYTSSAISASKTLLTNGNYGDIQIAPNGKIYISDIGSSALSVINNPNTVGLNCNFQANGITFPIGSVCLFGLPNFMDAGYILNPNDTLVYSYSKDTSFCRGQSITLIGNTNFPYELWSTGDSTITIIVSDTGKYWATYSLIKTCKEVDNFYVSFKNDPVINLGNDTMFYCTGSKKLNAYNQNASFIWNTGETTANITVTSPGIYWVEVNLDGCKVRDTINILTDTSQHIILYPNVLTPNQDGINDYIIFGNKLFSSLHLEIYNRWGKKLFESDDTMCFWWPEEQSITDGTYYYIAQYRIDCNNGVETKTSKGFITVLR